MDDNTKLAVLEGQISNFDKYLERIDITLQKLTEVSSSMEKMVVVQETRLNAQDEADRVLNEGQRLIHDRIDRLKEEMNKKLDGIDSKLAEIEKWRWLVIGGISLFMFIISNTGNLMNYFMS
ncbi:MAG TPA: hypothetical protein DCX27_19205 [Balneola sp.]|nr:hypothetical protein [Balneola sp.]|tara:strand:+ start:1008 stop:1373 length:366 start_codon:yes stop_codon:yes gene_type:complete